MKGTILAYHAVGACRRAEDVHNLWVAPGTFARQMEHLVEHHDVVPLQSFFDDGISRGSVAITFDDGYRSLMDNALPILERLGIPASVFVPTAYIGTTAEWLAPALSDFAIMDPSELAECDRRGLRVESHGHAHIDYSAATPAEIERDLTASIDALESILGRTPRYFAYPYGRSSHGARRIVASSGFDGAVSSEHLWVDRWAYPRVGITPFDGPRLFALKASGTYVRLRRSRLGAAAYALARPLVYRRWRGEG